SGDDSTSFRISNPGCDTVTLDSMSYHGNGTNISVSTAGSFPIKLLNGSFSMVKILLSNLVAGPFGGVLHIYYRLPDGSKHDTAFAVSALISGGTKTLAISTAPILFDTLRPCQSKDSTIV